jgi:hypothetical protein
MYLKGATLNIHRLSGIGNYPFVGSVRIAAWHETGAILNVPATKAKADDARFETNVLKASIYFDVISVTLKMAKKVVKTTHRTRSES